MHLLDCIDQKEHKMLIKNKQTKYFANSKPHISIKMIFKAVKIFWYKRMDGLKRDNFKKVWYYEVSVWSE